MIYMAFRAIVGLHFVCHILFHRVAFALDFIEFHGGGGGLVFHDLCLI